MALTSGAMSFVGGSTANFTAPQNFGNGQGSLTILDGGNSSFNPNAPFATPFEYCYYTSNVVGTNTISGLTRGVAGTTPHSFLPGAIVAQGLLAEDILASSTWKFDEQAPTSGSSITIPPAGSIPASYLGIPWRHIEIEYTLRDNSGNSADVLQMQFNGDAGNNYDYVVAGYNSGGNVTPVAATGVAFIRAGVAAGGTTAAGIANKGFIEILDAFEASWRKQIGSRCYRNDGGAFGTDWTNGDWHPATAVAITSITLSLAAGAFVGGCRITTRLKP